ncbi:diguanylate cyclase [Aliikangiella sp. G2MR2-5]|uniref:diguanylate cyclase n=1 Tax=Aliikangiella sp. G2MR2-5 TaxID=2788943 RepID=UPI0018ABAC1C
MSQEKSSGKVLVVDDITQNIDLLHQILAHKNYSVSGVPSGKLALKIAKNFKPDIILLDVMMPDMDGYETCRRLKDDPDTKEIPIIFVTAKKEPEDIARGFQCGGVDYITKPAREEEVWARVGHHIKIRRLIENQNKLIAKLSQMESQNRQIFVKASDPMLLVNKDGVIETVNLACEKTLECNNYQLAGKQFISIVSEQCRDKVEKSFSHVDESMSDTRNEPLETSIRILKPNNSEIPVELSVSSIGYENKRYLVLLHDLTIHMQLVNDLKDQTNIDKLTKIPNRRRIDEFLKDEWFRCLRKQRDFSLVFIDIDKFKEFNDNYGHQAGDKCLLEIAQALAHGAARASDLVGRYGGEEFIGILPETDIEGARELAEKLRKLVTNLNIAHKYSDVAPHVTISLGVASCIPSVETSATDLLEASDRALYEAKTSGRNKVIAVEI